MITPAQRLNPDVTNYQKALRQALCNLRVACPGIIQTFDPVKQVAEVSLSIRENVLNLAGYNGPTPIFVRKDVAIVPLPNVPVVFPRGGGMTLTFPLEKGDECLVIFSDMSIDGWWQNGGVQNQVESRRHDLNDGFALPGPWSQPNKLSDYSSSSIQLRTDDGATYLDIIDGQVTSSANILATKAASATFTDQTGRIMTIINGQVQNAEGAFGGLVNNNFFTQGTNAVNACKSIPDLQRLVNDLFGGFQPVVTDISSQVTSLTSILPGSLSTLSDVIGWINTFKSVISGPIAQLTSQLGSLTSAMTTMAAAATARATALGGSITIPPF